MSCSLYWKPQGSGHSVGDFQLRDAIENEYGIPCLLGLDSKPFLRGLAAADVDGAKKLLAAIEQHDNIDVWKEC